jgi:hypothetical protein
MILSDVQLMQLAGQILAGLLPAKMRVSMPGRQVADEELEDLADVSLRAAKALDKVFTESEDFVPSCKRCGCSITPEGFCEDETCPYHDLDQEAELKEGE